MANERERERERERGEGETELLPTLREPVPPRLGLPFDLAINTRKTPNLNLFPQAS